MSQHYRIELVVADNADEGDTWTVDDERLPLAVGVHEVMQFAVTDRHGVKRVTLTATVERLS